MSKMNMVNIVDQYVSVMISGENITIGCDGVVSIALQKNGVRVNFGDKFDFYPMHRVESVYGEILQKEVTL